MLCQIRIEKRNLSFLIGILGRTFFIKSRLLITFYSNIERKGQYTGWVEKVVILGPTHDPKLRDIKEYTSLGLIRDLRQE
jgi:hypothetical protein|uniref:Uncharacterized protein n=1 Tax=Salix suchowensis TaxID=1278906 RepID=A0A7R5XYK9_9ROSI|nr:hypothetical protein [Salix suchowensis]